MRDGDLLGRLIDTFVTAHLRPELELETPRPALHHVREKDGRREGGLVIELATGTALLEKALRLQLRARQA